MAHLLAILLTVGSFTLRTFDGREVAAEQITIAVPENRAAADSRWIRVSAVRLPARKRSGAPPIVFLSGGPGLPASVLARVPVYYELFDALRDDGDVLLLDQRGSGMSLPNLTCPAADVPRDFLASDESLRAALAARVGDCAAYWRAGGVDLRGYSTREIAADVDALRRAVGASQVKLLAFSYGSEVALEVLRQQPRRVDRVVFASTRAPDTLLKHAAAWDAQLAALGIDKDVAQLVQQLDASPQTVNGFRIGGIALLSALRNDLPDGRATPKLRAFVDEVRTGNTTALGQRVEQQWKGLQSFNLMTLAVDCSSGWSEERLRATRDEAQRSVMRNVNLQWDPSICATFGESPRPPAVPRSNVRALFITGSRDPNAPPAQTEALRRRAFPRSRHEVVENGSHETLPDPKVRAMVVEFLH
ncbi:MAG TPA: alpha/beta fold hydrolase [Thermoanaerobaculia bacterium]|jgi:pimeloyl-ACP methyl ester carboxylesterase